MITYLLSVGADLADLEPFYIEQVQWASSEVWYPKLALKEGSLDNTPDCTGEQVDKIPLATALEVYNLLQKGLKLPSDIAGAILDIAEYWVHATAMYNKEILVTEDSQLEQPYISVKVIGQCQAPTHVRRIIFSTKSHDQGS